MKQAIEEALRPLMGEPLTDMWRYAGFQKFEFGVPRPARNRKGEEISVADWGLVVACDWRLAGPEGVVVSSEEFGPHGSRRDQAAHGFYALLEADPPVVEAIETGSDGAFLLRLSRGFTLEVRPLAELGSEEEQWRLMGDDRRRSDFVLWGGGPAPPAGEVYADFSPS